jgi:S1/P1 Nuclease
MKKTLLHIILCLVSIQSFAWGPTGHRVTGYIAEQYLNAKAKSKIREILGQESLWMVSTWMDDIRSDSTYNYTADWHWVTVQNGMTYEQSVKNPHGDVIMTIERLIRELKSRQLSHGKEIEALKMLIHLIGDIHQPLHVGCCDDQGGNKVKVKWFRNESNIHRVWDSDMIDDTKLSFTELSQTLIRPDKTMVSNWQRNSISDWFTESMGYRTSLYEIGDGNLGYKYSYKHLAEVKIRLMQGGIRLAGVLNQIYG